MALKGITLKGFFNFHHSGKCRRSDLHSSPDVCDDLKSSAHFPYVLIKFPACCISCTLLLMDDLRLCDLEHTLGWTGMLLCSVCSHTSWSCFTAVQSGTREPAGPGPPGWTSAPSCAPALWALMQKTSTANKPHPRFINENPHQPQAETTVTLTWGSLLIGRLHDDEAASCLIVFFWELSYFVSEWLVSVVFMGQKPRRLDVSASSHWTRPSSVSLGDGENGGEVWRNKENLTCRTYCSMTPHRTLFLINW